jgi:2-polyprenyl-3-methyl-5-hydroxy-6-metoxy-1,4-benzoquinol methylase
MEPFSDEKIVQSWMNNASPWTKAVRDKEIESRKLATDKAILDAVMARSPRTALDIGCGEGWLARELASRGIQVTGVDVVPELIDKAREAGGGDFRVASYEDIAAGKLSIKVDAAIANFSLIGKEVVESLIAAIPQLLASGGALLIQTPHPLMASADQPYREGWREGSWAGFNTDFIDPAPWYFRTLESWVRTIRSNGLELVNLIEPLHPGTGKPASLILVAEQARKSLPL